VGRKHKEEIVDRLPFVEVRVDGWSSVDEGGTLKVSIGSKVLLPPSIVDTFGLLVQMYLATV
jgi:hypothetical protein